MPDTNALPDITDFSPTGRLRLAVAFLENGRRSTDATRLLEVVLALIDSARLELGATLTGARLIEGQKLADSILSVVDAMTEGS
jgi:hypothetical protein